MLIVSLLAFCAAGCTYLPRPSRQPLVQNPFPQLSRVAVAPFLNLSTEPSVDGRQFGLAYFNELQATPGFEVVPVGVVEEVMREYGITLASGEEARKLAQVLKVDAVIVGAVTDYSPYYPPRCGLQVAWYAANPCFHPIPPGYGLPWGTPDEQEIPPNLVYEAEMSLARAQMETQTPGYEAPDHQPAPSEFDDGAEDAEPLDPRTGVTVAHQEPVKPNDSDKSSARAPAAPAPRAPAPNSTANQSVGLPEDWPDPSGLTPAAPAPVCPTCEESDEPVLLHTRIYHGDDADFTEALENYAYFRDDARQGGYRNALQRPEDFVRFCCRMHLSEMLTARGGAGESRVVWRRPANR